MLRNERVWMTQQAYARLQNELATLRARRGIEVPDDLVDYDESRITADRARQGRIRQIHDFLANAILGVDPDDDGIAEPGMVLTIRYDDSGEIETFLLGVRGAENAGIEVYSTRSPLGRAIAGARPGEARTYSAPSGKSLAVTLLQAVPYGTHRAKAVLREKDLSEESRRLRAPVAPADH